MFLAQLLGDGRQRFLVARAQGNPASLGREGFGGGEAKSLTGRGDQRDTVFQPKVHSV